MDFDRWKQKRILVVDDEPGLLQMVVSILNQDGYTQIKTAGTVREALGVCQEWTPELAVLDVMLPDGDGFFLFEPVSYTHLDVYKRQARECPIPLKARKYLINF